MPEQILETATAVREATGSSIALELITPGWGSSGYYSPQVLEAAGRDRVFPAGTHMYIDHPSASEDRDRPERSVRDLAAVLTTDATWNGSALVAEARVFAPYQQLLAEAKDAIGVSIRAAGDMEMGEAEGRRGRIITSLVHSTSVDFVTRAGRGGRITELLESARPTRTHVAEARNVGQWVESQIHKSFTVMADDMAADGRLSRDERIALSSAIGDGLAAFVASLEASSPQLYQRDIWDEPTDPQVSETRDVPVDPAGGSPTQESQEDTTMPQIEEGRLAQLEEAAGRVQTLESERDAHKARADRAELALAEATARHAARPVVAAKVAESKVLGPRTQARLVESVLADLPVADGKVADDALTAAVTAAVEAAEAEIADYRSPAPTFGTFGSATESTGQPAGEISEADYDRASASIFGRRTVRES